MGRGRAIRLLALGLGAVVYGLVFAELFLRVLDPQVLMPRYVTGTGYGIRGNIANAVYRQSTPEVDVEMRINAQGMRSHRDLDRAKPPGTCRIALMGDSYFMGYEVTYEATMGRLIETRLAARGYRVEVLNFAVSGFSTEEMLRVFDARALEYAPDIVVYQFNGGDFGDNMRPGLYRPDPSGVPQPTGADYLPGIAIRDRLMQFGVYRWLIANSHAYSAIREWVGQTAKRMITRLAGLRQSFRAPAPAPAPAPVSADPVPRALPAGLERRVFEGELDRFFPEHQTRYTSGLIELSRQRALAAGVEWFLLEIPDPVYLSHYTNLGKLALGPGTWARVVTPMEAFAARPPDSPPLYRLKGHFHLSELGHDLTTDALLQAIEAEAGARLAACRQG